MFLRRALALAAVLFLARAAAAMTIYLEGGNSIEGRVRDLTEKAVILEIEGVEGSRLTIPLSRVSDYSLYRIKRSRINRRSVAEIEKLGDWAMERKLYAFGMEEYAAAVQLAGKEAPEPLRKKLADASRRCGKDKLRRAKALIEAGELKAAQSFYRDILRNHPSCPAARTARAEIDRLGALIRKNKRETDERESARAALEQMRVRLETVEELLRSGDRARGRGLAESGRFGRAEDAFLEAVDAYRRAGRELVSLRKLKPSGETLARIEKSESRVRRGLVQAYVDLGHNSVVKGNLTDANHYMGLALALDPNDPKALALRQEIAAATANDRWGRPGRR